MPNSKRIADHAKEQAKRLSSIGNGHNHTMVGMVTPFSKFQYAIQPHNHRRYYNFVSTPQSLQTIPQIAKKHGIEGVKVTQKNYGKETTIRDFWGCTIIIHKSSAEVINKWQGKAWKVIEGQTIEEVNKKIDEYCNSLDSHSDDALKKVIEFGGGSSDLVCIKQRGEIGIHGDEFLDSLPENLIIQDTIFKKLYKKKPEVFLDDKGKPAYVKNYITNRALEDIAPQIAEAINGVINIHKAFYESHQAILTRLEDNINSHLALIQEYRKEAALRSEEAKKPFFIKWWEFFKGVK